MHNVESDNRRELRFHPVCEQLTWRKVGLEPLEHGRLIDVSQTGLSFRVPAASGVAIERGDEISVRHMGRDNQPTHYAIVWRRAAEDGVAVGCTRLSAISALARPRPLPSRLIIARLRQNLERRGSVRALASHSAIAGQRLACAA